jgi:hypothetical protein
MQFDNAHVVRQFGCGFGHIGALDGCAACHSWHNVSGRCDNDNERHCFAVIPSSGSDGGLVGSNVSATNRSCRHCQPGGS